MAEPISPSHQSGAASYRNEWSALLECASPSHDRQRLGGLLHSVEWARLLVLAEEHGVVGHLAASLHDLEGDLVPPEMRQVLVERQRAQVEFSLGESVKVTSGPLSDFDGEIVDRDLFCYLESHWRGPETS